MRFSIGDDLYLCTSENAMQKSDEASNKIHTEASRARATNSRLTRVIATLRVRVIAVPARGRFSRKRFEKAKRQLTVL